MKQICFLVVKLIDNNIMYALCCRPNDCIVRVNNLDCSNVSKRMVLETVRSNGGTALIVVRRRRVGARSLYTTQVRYQLCAYALDELDGCCLSFPSPCSFHLRLLIYFFHRVFALSESTWLSFIIKHRLITISFLLTNYAY